jgi:hypothetical protein
MHVNPDAAGLPRAHRAIARLKHWTGLDRAIAYTVMARGWAACVGVVNVVLVAHFLSPAEQGYYYTFSSLVALQIVFELGFSFVILQLAAHERTLLRFSANGLVEGDAVAHARLASVLQNCVRWYSAGAVMMVCTLLPVGLYFFTSHQRVYVAGWRPAWCLLALFAGVTFQIDPIFSFLEGCGYVSRVARMRLLQTACASLLAWGALIGHHGLFAPAAMIGGQALVGAICLFRWRAFVFGLLRHSSSLHAISWRREIFPFQWRIAVSWICGYFIYQLFNPVLFAYQGPVAAGRMGMSLSIVTSMGGLGIAWMGTKASPFGALISQHRYDQLDELFFRTLWQSLSLLLPGGLLFLGGLIYAGQHYPHLAARVFAPWAFALLLLTMVSNHIMFSEALYLRAHKREPFLIPSIVNALMVGACTYYLGRYVSANAVVIGYFVGSGILSLAFGSYVFVSKRRDWHSPTRFRNASSAAAAMDAARQ